MRLRSASVVAVIAFGLLALPAAEAVDAEALDARGRLAVERLAAGDAVAAEALLLRNWVERTAAGPSSGDPRPSRGLLGGRGRLAAGDAEPDGYGLYSYLLFDSPPRDDAERQRHLKAIEAHLALLPAIAELERYQRRSRLNLTLLPVRQPGADGDADDRDAAVQALQAYDYARAKVLLDRFGRADAAGGPFLVSRRPGAAGGSVCLFVDLSRVEPALVWDWTRSHAWLAAEERSWSDAALQRLVLQLRNAIAVAARQPSDLAGALWRRVELVTAR